MAVVRALQPIPNQGAHTREDLFSVALTSATGHHRAARAVEGDPVEAGEVRASRPPRQRGPQIRPKAWEPVGLRLSPARSGPSKNSFCRICRPLVQLGNRKQVFSASGEAKNGLLRPFRSRHMVFAGAQPCRLHGLEFGSASSGQS